ncbi:MAG: DUF3276 family protein [Treponema sp.]|jgi:hypothetical protein|nr:DUF3276 family protein [Treponema sp.]
MGVRGEIFSNKVILPNRTYFFNVKENRMGDLYLNIVESKNRDNGGFERQSVILFADDLQEFLKGFDESLKVLEKTVRDKRHPKPKRGEEDTGNDMRYSPRRGAEDSGNMRRSSKRGTEDASGTQHNNIRYSGKNRQGKSREDGDNRRKKDRPDYSASAEKYARKQRPQREFDSKPDFGQNDKPGGNKRIVVKKKW